jgi:hypothetical protein
MIQTTRESNAEVEPTGDPGETAGHLELSIRDSTIMKTKIVFLIVILFSVLTASPSLAWHDHTHLAVAKAAGYRNWYNSAGADIAKVKAGDVEKKNHYYNNYANVPVTDALVLSQVKAYDSPSDDEGHLYGAIIASVREYLKKKSNGKYAEYPLAYAAHSSLTCPSRSTTLHTMTSTRPAITPMTASSTKASSTRSLRSKNTCTRSS